MKILLDASQTIYWLGWETTWAELKESGWEISFYQSCTHKKIPFHGASERIYLRHPNNRMLGRITITHKEIFNLDFLIQEKNQRIKPPKILEERELTIDDVSTLMQIILNLQKKVIKKKLTSNKIREQVENIFLKNVA